jgi:hypothetical protein
LVIVGTPRPYHAPRSHYRDHNPEWNLKLLLRDMGPPLVGHDIGLYFNDITDVDWG